ncbi:dipeptidase [Modestobacter sp. I12A-02628]|nr:dipeptidase [Goekera deserti]NDI46576.1 dipeptidase [Goekera deserti]
MGDPRVAAVPVREGGDPLVDLRGTAIALDPRKAAADGSYAHLRRDVVRRLERAQTLLPGGLRLLVVEGHRPPALQQHYFAEYRAGLAVLHPDWDDDRLDRAASRYVSPPAVAPHPAGAAVDLTLTTADGVELDMGTRVNADPEESHGACYTDAPGLPARARAHRRTLADALTAVGLVNYPTEWWHWSHGDRYWALATGAPAAVHGPVELPTRPGG